MAHDYPRIGGRNASSDSQILHRTSASNALKTLQLAGLVDEPAADDARVRQQALTSAEKKLAKRVLRHASEMLDVQV